MNKCVALHIYVCVCVLYCLFYKHSRIVPVPVPAQSKAWVSGHPLVVIAGSNSAGAMDLSLVHFCFQ